MAFSKASKLPPFFPFEDPTFPILFRNLFLYLSSSLLFSASLVRSSSVSGGDVISRARTRTRNHESSSTLDDESEDEFGNMEVDAERDREEEEEEEAGSRQSVSSINDVQRHGIEESRAIDAVRAAAGLEAMRERGRGRSRNRAVSDYTLDSVGDIFSGRGMDMETYPHPSAEPSFSLFEDRNGDSDDDTTRRPFGSSRTRLDMDEDRDSADIEGEEEGDIERRGRSSISSGLSGLSSSRYAGSLIGDPRRRSGSSDRGRDGGRERLGGSGNGFGHLDGSNPFAAIRTERSYSLASTGSLSGSERARSSTSSFSDLGFGREGEREREEHFLERSGVNSLTDSRVRVVRSPIVSDTTSLQWDDMHDASNIDADGDADGGVGVGVRDNSSVAGAINVTGVDSLYSSLNVPHAAAAAAAVDLK